jgi:hypothetical protein
MLLVEGQPMWPVFSYFQARNLDYATEATYATAIGLLVDFVGARAADYVDVTRRTAMFNAFAHAVLDGTVRDGDDPTGLWWHPRTGARAKKLIALACEVSDWLATHHGADPINPFMRRASPSEQIAFWRRWNTEKATSLLGHTKATSQVADRARKARVVAQPGGSLPTRERPPYFPEGHIEALLFEGFLVPGDQKDKRPWVRWNLRDILITLLLHFGGLRMSEPMHLWVDDIFVDPSDQECARVLVHHPRDGIYDAVDRLTGKRSRTTRAAYLRSMYNRVPLTEMSGHRHAGWKNSLLNNRDRNAFEVFWFPRSMGVLFLKLFRLYITHVRSVTAKHPYLFVTQDGQPMGTLTFTKNHGRAVRRIGLDVAKHLGTTPHGHRHAYGQRLKDAGLNEKDIQLAMHHVSSLSQAVYTEPEADEVAARMRSAEHVMNSTTLTLTLPPLLGN